MVEVEHYKTKEKLSFTNGKELKEMLELCNPLWLMHYKKQIEKSYSFLKIEGCGLGINIVRLDLRGAR